MSPPSPEDPRCVSGMLLAAVTCDDASGDAARAGLSEELTQALDRRLAEIASKSREARRGDIIALTGAIGAVPGDAWVPATARPLLAGALPAARRAEWLEGAPAPRRGFSATRALRGLVRALATSNRSEACDEERAAGAEPGDDERLQRWAARLATEAADSPSEARVLGALRLGARGQTRGDAQSTRWRAIGAELARRRA